MAGYATLVSALAALFSSLSLLGHSIQLPLSTVVGKEMAASAARMTGVEESEGTAAYGKAPFRQPALRYLYSVGWVGAASHLASCKGDLVFGDPVAAAAQMLQKSPSLLARLHVAHLSLSEASEAIGRGFQDGCT